MKTDIVNRLSQLPQQHTGLVFDHIAAYHFRLLTGVNQGKLLLIPLELINLMLSDLFPQSELTPAETKLAVMLSMNISLKESAELGGVSYETRRTQLKAIYQKLGMNRQAEVASCILVNVLLNFSVVIHPDRLHQDHEAFNQFVERFLPASTRSHVVVAEDGSQRRFLDVGSTQGTPCIFIHHMGALFFSEIEVEALNKLNMRLICPLRNGVLAPNDKPLLLRDHIDHAMESIEIARNMFCADSPNIVCTLSGAFYALEYARKQPGSISKLILIGAPYKALKTISPAEKFRDFFYRAALQNPWLLNKLIQYIAKRTADHEYSKKFFLLSYNDSPADVKVIEREFDDEMLASAFIYRVQNCLANIPHDLYLQGEQNWDSLASAAQQLHFIHGTEDRVHPISAIQQLVSNLNNAELHAIPDVGSMFNHENLVSAFQCIESIVRSQKFSVSIPTLAE